MRVRKAAKTDRERAELLNTLIAYSGTYTVEGEKAGITNVLMRAWNPEWVGTKQYPYFKLDGERLMVLMPRV